jgi:uncharacterized protein YndB with AHSA1/START domain
MKGEVREIIPPERLVFTNIAVDAAGNSIIDGFTTVTFAEEGGKARLTLHTPRRRACRLRRRLSARHGDGLDDEHR